MPAKRRKTTLTKRVASRKKRKLFSFLSRGKMSLGIVVIMGLVIVGSMYIIGGIVPEGSKYKPLSDTPYELDFSKSTVGDPNNPDQLKLKTVPFKECAQTVAINFLIDVSGSMNSSTGGASKKIDKTIEAITLFINSLPDNAAIAVQKFSSPPSSGANGATVVQEFALYKDVKTTLPTKISALTPPEGSTYTRSGFDLAKTTLNNAIDSNKYPGYSYALIFISDGIPEFPSDQFSNCLKVVDMPESPGRQRCFSKTMDPRFPTNLPDEIKNKGVKMFSIGIYNSNTNTSDYLLLDELRTLLKDVASDPDDTYYQETFDAARLPEMIKTVSSRVCG